LVPGEGEREASHTIRGVIPLPVILVEFLVAFGVALFGANTVALVRLRRDGNWPPTRGAGDAGPAPSAARIVTGIVVGLVVTLWALATWFAHGFRF
jgi:hypothetical protein